MNTQSIQITLERTPSSSCNIIIHQRLMTGELSKSMYSDPTIRLLETDEQVVESLAHSIRLALRKHFL